MFWSRKKPVAHASAPNLYQFHKGEIILPGAEAYVFQQPQTLPIVLLRGAGSHAGQMQVLAGPQIYANLAIPVSSLGGIQHGQMAMQPLIDPSNLVTPVGLGL